MFEIILRIQMKEMELRDPEKNEEQDKFIEKIGLNT